VAPRVRDGWLEHDAYFTRRPFPTRRAGRGFVGQPFDEHDRPLIEGPSWFAERLAAILLRRGPAVRLASRARALARAAPLPVLLALAVPWRRRVLLPAPDGAASAGDDKRGTRRSGEQLVVGARSRWTPQRPRCGRIPARWRTVRDQSTVFVLPQIVRDRNRRAVERRRRLVDTASGSW
jgi:hypothetical protein